MNTEQLEQSLREHAPTIPIDVSNRLAAQVEADKAAPSAAGRFHFPHINWLSTKTVLSGLCVMVLVIGVTSVALNSTNSDNQPGGSSARKTLSTEGSFNGGSAESEPKSKATAGATANEALIGPEAPSADRATQSAPTAAPQVSTSKATDSAALPTGPIDGNTKLTSETSVLVNHDDFADASARILQAAVGVDATIVDSQVTVSQPVSSGNYSLQVPRAKYGDFMRQLAGIGDVTSANQTIADQTKTQTGIKSSLTPLQQQELRLLKIRKKRALTSEEQYQLDNVRTQIKQYNAQLDASKESVDKVAVTVTLVDRASFPTQPATGWTAEHMLHIAGHIASVIGSILLLLGLILIIPAMIYGVYRLITRKKD